MPTNRLRGKMPEQTGTATTAMPPTEAEILELARQFEDKSAQEVIGWTLETYRRGVAISTSFQAESMVILDIAHGFNPNVRVFTIDTERLSSETYELIEKVRDHYRIDVETFYPDKDDLSQMTVEHGVDPFYKSVSLRLLCCQIRKVNPMNRALEGLDAWMSGLRRSQSKTRARTDKIEVDTVHGGVVKVNPLADWSHEQVWAHIRGNDVPYNELYDRGYTSIGCDPCTRAIEPGEDLRAGRWWWEDGMPKECGIHLGPAWGRTK